MLYYMHLEKVGYIMENIKFNGGHIDRKALINLLKTSKIYYINIFDEIEEYKTKQELEDQLDEVNEIINNAKHLNALSYAFDVNMGMIPVNYYPFISEKMNEIDILIEEKKENVIDIDESYSLERIGKELSKIGEEEDAYRYYKYSKLKELRDIKEKGSEKILQYLKENSQK